MKISPPPSLLWIVTAKCGHSPRVRCVGDATVSQTPFPCASAIEKLFLYKDGSTAWQTRTLHPKHGISGSDDSRPAVLTAAGSRAAAEGCLPSRQLWVRADALYLPACRPAHAVLSDLKGLDKHNILMFCLPSNTKTTTKNSATNTHSLCWTFPPPCSSKGKKLTYTWSTYG